MMRVRDRESWWIPSVIATVLVASVMAPPAGAEPAGSPPPGEIVSVQPLPPELSLPGAPIAEKLEYRTEWRSGEATIATGALFLPERTAPEGGFPVVAWAHGTVGIADDCAFTTETPRPAREKSYLRHWLDQGYAVVAADYPGLGSEGLHRYLDGPSAANSIVDSVRAARATGAPLSERWVVVGHSQGGHAAVHTAHIATRRAPELDFRGTVATGVPANLENLFILGVPGFPDPGLSGLTAFSGYLFAGLRDAYPQVDVDGYLTPAGREVLDRAEVLCISELNASVRDTGIGDLPARPLSQGDLPAALAEYLAVPTTGYDRPLFFGHGVDDRVVPLPLSAKLAADMSAGGADVDYRVYDADHLTVIELSALDSTPFVARVLADR